MKKIMPLILIVVLLGLGYGGLKLYATKVATTKVDAAIASSGAKADISYDKLSINPFTRKIVVSGITISPENGAEDVTVREFKINSMDQKNKVPNFMSISCNGISIDIDAIEKHNKELSDLGYDNKIDFNLGFEYEYKPAQRELDLKRVSLGADEVGDVSLSVQFGNIEIDSTNPESFGFDYPEILINSANVTYKDDSFVNRLIGLTAQKQGLSTDEKIANISSEMNAMLSAQSDPLTVNLLTGLKAFIEDPKELSLTASPETPVALKELLGSFLLNPLVLTSKLAIQCK